MFYDEKDREWASRCLGTPTRYQIKVEHDKVVAKDKQSIEQHVFKDGPILFLIRLLHYLGCDVIEGE